MLGRLPLLHRRVIGAVAVAVFLAAGAVAGLATTDALTPTTGLLVGALAGIAVAFLLVHDFGAHEVSPGRAGPPARR